MRMALLPWETISEESEIDVLEVRVSTIVLAAANTTNIPIVTPTINSMSDAPLCWCMDVLVMMFMAVRMRGGIFDPPGS